MRAMIMHELQNSRTYRFFLLKHYVKLWQQLCTALPQSVYKYASAALLIAAHAAMCSAGRERMHAQSASQLLTFLQLNTAFAEL